MKLTQKVAEGATPRASDYALRDDTLPGFALRVRPSGHKTWTLYYRSKSEKSDGRERRMTLGRWPQLTQQAARERARQLLAAVARGEDPAGQRDKRRGMPTVAEVADLFLREHVTLHNRTKTEASVRSILKQHLLPAFGSKRIDAVTRQDVSKLHHRLNEMPYQANRTLACISSLFAFAAAKGLLPEGTNPARGIRRYAEAKRERFLSAAELAKLGEVLRDGEVNRREPWQAIAAVRLLLFTGCRKNEVLRLRWRDVDAERGTIELVTTKTGARTVYSTPPVAEVLGDLPRRNQWVFPREADDSKPWLALQGPWVKIRARAGIDGVRIHDLRHTAASLGAGAGMSLPLIGGLLGHKVPSTTARYAHLANDPLRAAAELVANKAAAALDKPLAEVVPIRGGREAT